MCDGAAPGVCAVGSFLAGTLMASGFGFVSEGLGGTYAAVPGLSVGATLGTLAAAFPDKPEPRPAAMVLGAAVVAASLACAIDHLLTEAVVTAAAANAGLLCSGALQRRRRRRRVALVKETTAESFV